MTRYVALLRGINVSGQKIIKMEQLRGIFTRNGFDNVVSYIQSGNILFDSALSETEIKEQIEQFLLSELGYSVAAIVRTVTAVKEVSEILDEKVAGLAEQQKLYVYFFDRIPSSTDTTLLAKHLNENEKLEIAGREMYFWSPGFGNSRLTNANIEKLFGVWATARNPNTVKKIISL